MHATASIIQKPPAQRTHTGPPFCTGAGSMPIKTLATQIRPFCYVGPYRHPGLA
jgi:hypothetical protein